MNQIVKTPKTFTVDLLLSKMAQAKGFPSLSSTVTEIIENLQTENVNLQSVVDTISIDFSLTQKILKLVNSAMYSSFARNVDTLSQAIQLLGFDAISHLAVSLKLLDAVALKEDANNDLLNKTILASEISKTLVNGLKAEQASISTLIYNLGSLMVSRFSENEFAEIKKLADTGICLDDACIAVLGMTYTQVGLEIAKRWKFPDSLLGIIDGTGNKELLNIAKFSNTASALLVENKTEELAQYKEDNKELGFDFTNFDALANDVLANNKLSNDRPQNASSKVLRLFDIIDLYEKTGRSVSYRDFIKNLCTDLVNTLNAQRACLLIINSNQHIKGSYGNEKSLELSNKIDISLQKIPSIFNAVALAKKDYHVVDISKFKRTMLPTEFDFEYFDIQSFMLLPIVLRTKVFGFLYIDWNQPQTFVKDELVAIRKIRDLLSTHIPR